MSSHLEKAALIAALTGFAFAYTKKIQCSPLFSSKALILLPVPVLVSSFVYTYSSYYALYPGDMDFTNISEALRRTAYGDGLLPTPYVATGQSGSFLGHHFSPSLLLYVPFYSVWNLPAIGGIFRRAAFHADLPVNHWIYGWILWTTLLAGLILWTFYYKKTLTEKNALMLLPFSVMIAAGFSGIWRLAGSFHFEILVIPLGALFIRCSSRSSLKNPAFWISFILFLGIKEDIAVYTFFWGIFLFFSEKKSSGLAVLAGSTVWFAAAIILKYLYSGGDGPDWTGYWMSSEFPYATTAADRLKAFIYLMLSAGGIIFAAPVYFITVIIPAAAVHFFSSHPWHNIYYGHYAYSLIPFILEGIRRGFININNFYKNNKYSSFYGNEAAAALLAVAFHFFVSSSDREIPFRKMEADPRFSDALELSSYTEPQSCVIASIPLSPLLPLDVNAYPLYKVKNNPFSPDPYNPGRCGSVYLFAEKNKGRPPFYSEEYADQLVNEFRHHPHVYTVTDRDSLILIHIRKNNDLQNSL